MHPRHYHAPWKRALYSCLLVSTVMVVGTIGMHLIEGMAYLDAFYFMSMIATAQGPSIAPASPAGKLFTSIMAFVCVGTVVAALGFLFGPFFGTLWKIGVERLEHESNHKQRDSESRH